MSIENGTEAPRIIIFRPMVEILGRLLKINFPWIFRFKTEFFLIARLFDVLNFVNKSQDFSLSITHHLNVSLTKVQSRFQSYKKRPLPPTSVMLHTKWENTKHIYTGLSTIKVFFVIKLYKAIAPTMHLTRLFTKLQPEKWVQVTRLIGLTFILKKTWLGKR